MDTVQFPGETPFDAVVNHYSMDIEEEAEWREYLAEAAIDPRTASLDTLAQAVTRWHQALPRDEKAE